MTLNGAGNPVIAYHQGFGGSNAEALRVAEHDGTVWRQLGQLDFAPDANTRLGLPRIATATDGRPWLAWAKSTNELVNLFRYDGTAFVAVPIVPTLTTSGGEVVGITFLNGDPVVAGVSRAGFVELRRFRNGAWEPATSYGPLRVQKITLMSSGSSVLAGHAVFSGSGGRGVVIRVAFP